jgi:MFS family permease
VVRVRLVAGAAIVFSAVTAVTGLMPTWGLYAVTLPLCGLTAMTFTTAVQSFVQLRTPAHLRGRVMGFYTVLFFAGTPIGAPLIGWLSDQFGPRVGLVGGGLISLLGALALTAMLLRRRLAQSTDRQGHTRDAGGE